LPLASVLSPLVDLAIAFVLLMALMVVYGIAPGPAVLLAPVFLLGAVATAFTVALWCAALNAVYRDVRYAVPFLIQLWMFASPVVYPSRLVPSEWRWLYGLNPMAGVIEGFRWALLGQGAPLLPLAASAISVCVALIGGLVYFARVETTVVDVV